MTNREKQEIVESLIVKAAKITKKLTYDIDATSFTRGTAAEINTKRALDACDTLRHELGDLAAAIERGDV